MLEDESYDFKTEIKKYGLKIIYYNALGDMYKDFIKKIIKDKNFKIKNLLNKINHLEKTNNKLISYEKKDESEDIVSLNKYLVKENRDIKKKIEEIISDKEKDIYYYKNKYYFYEEECINKDNLIRQNEDCLIEKEKEIEKLKEINNNYEKNFTKLKDKLYDYEEEINILKNKLFLTGYKTQACIYYKKGYCKNGNNCTFAHGI